MAALGKSVSINPFLFEETGLRHSNIPDIEHKTILKFMLTALASRNNLGRNKEREPK